MLGQGESSVRPIRLGLVEKAADRGTVSAATMMWYGKNQQKISGRMELMGEINTCRQIIT
jgi:hypothetical protein